MPRGKFLTQTIQMPAVFAPIPHLPARQRAHVRWADEAGYAGAGGGHDDRYGVWTPDSVGGGVVRGAGGGAVYVFVSQQVGLVLG